MEAVEMHSMIESRVWSVCREPVNLLLYDREYPRTTREVDLAIFENVFTQTTVIDNDRIMWWLEEEFNYGK